MSGGAYQIFWDRPIAVVMFGFAVVLIMLALKPLISKGPDWRAAAGLDD
jgi:TctA family transporter